MNKANLTAHIMELDGVNQCTVVDCNNDIIDVKDSTGISSNGILLAYTKLIGLQLRSSSKLNANDTASEVLITSAKHYHIIQPISLADGLFICIEINKFKSNLSQIRRCIRELYVQPSF
jgi:hypothetical protein